MIVMGIETSCDETSVSIVRKSDSSPTGIILGEITVSQIEKHQPYGGVVPELSSREHIKYLDKTVKKVIKNSGIKVCQIDAFAATTGPGLLGGLLVGSNYAKALSISSNKPFLSVNHLQAHVLVPRMKNNIKFPFLVLLISGGHTQLLIAKDYNNFQLLGQTLDDAVGEAFDKTAKLLGLKYPGGPQIEKIARLNRLKEVIDLPRPLIRSKNFNFSFSGLKTSIRRIIENKTKRIDKNHIAFNFQNAILDCLLDRTALAMDFFKTKYNNKYFILSGGVASNKFIRKGFRKLAREKNFNFFVPESKLCTDNGTMIAWAGVEKLINGEKNNCISISPKPRWPLESLMDE